MFATRHTFVLSAFALGIAMTLSSGCERESADVSIVTLEQAESAAVAAPAPDYYWVELGPDNLVLARAVMLNGSCPDITVDGTAAAMQQRGSAPPPGFSEAVVCEYSLPDGTASASIGSQNLALPKTSLQRVVVVGDTGCRVKGSDIQDCTGQGSGELWDFDDVADAIAASNPDLIVHVGDYHYREYGTCDARCIQANIGYTWVSWQADFFDPAKTILKQAPWVFIRGNHEDCSRAWKGWFYLLDPHKLADNPWSNCADYTDPYQLTLGSQQIIVMDTAVIPDDYSATPDPAAVTRYANEFNSVENMAAGQSSAWLSTHRPIWAIASFVDSSGNPALAATDRTLQQAIAKSTNQQLPNPPINALLAGHIHQFERINLDNNRPVQLVFGGGATELDPQITDQLLNDNPDVLQELGVSKSDLDLLHEISFGVMDKNTGCGWNVDVRDSSGNSVDEFTIGC